MSPISGNKLNIIFKNAPIKKRGGGKLPQQRKIFFLVIMKRMVVEGKQQIQWELYLFSGLSTYSTDNLKDSHISFFLSYCRIQ